MVSRRDDTVCNFLEGPSKLGEGEHRLIYRHYATLYFVFCVDSSESELGILDLIQVIVFHKPQANILFSLEARRSARGGNVWANSY